MYLDAWINSKSLKKVLPEWGVVERPEAPPEEGPPLVDVKDPEVATVDVYWEHLLKLGYKHT